VKKSLKKIAVILVLVMFVNIFTGCFTIWAFKQETEVALLVFPIPLFPALDVVSSPIQLIIFLIELDISKDLKKKAEKLDNVDTFSTDTNIIPREKINTLSNKLSALPDEEIADFTNIINSLSEAEITAIINAFNTLSEEEIASSVETLNLMSDKTLIAVMNNSQYAEFRNLD